MIGLRFYLTYKELKLPCLMATECYRQSFYSTYKKLKHHCLSSVED
mgnify:CR=1 FL=1